MFVHVLKNVLNLNRTHKRRRVRYSVVFVILSTPPRRVCVCDFCRDKSRRKSYVNRTVLQRRRRKKSSENVVLEKGREQMFGMTTAVSRYLHVVCAHGSRQANDFYPWWRIIFFFFLLFSFTVLKNERDPCQILVRVCFCAHHRQSPSPQTGLTTQTQTMFFFSKHSPTRCSRHRTEIHSLHYQSTDNLSRFDTTIKKVVVNAL